MRQKAPMFYSAVLLTAANLLLRLVSTSFQVYLSGRIGPAGVGLLQLVLSVSGLFVIAGTAGIRTAAMYLTAGALGRRCPGHISSVLAGCFRYSLVCSALVGGLVFWFAPALSAGWIGDVRTQGALRLFALFLPVTCLCGVMTGYFTAAGRIGALAAVEAAEQLCSMAVTAAALTFWAGRDPGRACEAVILGTGAGACLTFLCLVLLRLREPRVPKIPTPVFRPLWDTAVPLALADNLKAGISTAENLMVPRRLALFSGTKNSLALFGTVCGMVFPVMMFPASLLYGLAELLIPELARCAAAGSLRRVSYLVRRSLRVSMLYGIACGGLLFLLAEPLCGALYPGSHAGQYLRWFSLAVPMLYCDTITDAATKGLGQQKTCVRYNILTSALDVLFLYLLLPKYGILGYFISFVLTHLLNFILSLRRLFKITGETLPASVPARALSAALLALRGAACVTEPFLCACAYLALLGSLLTLFGVVGREDLLWLGGLVQKKKPKALPG